MEITKFDHNLKKIIVTIKFNDPIIDIMKFLIYEEKKLQNLQKVMNDINMLMDGGYTVHPVPGLG